MGGLFVREFEGSMAIFSPETSELVLENIMMKIRKTPTPASRENDLPIHSPQQLSCGDGLKGLRFPALRPEFKKAIMAIVNCNFQTYKKPPEHRPQQPILEM